MFFALPLLSYTFTSCSSLQRSQNSIPQCYVPKKQVGKSYSMLCQREARNQRSLLLDLPLELRLLVYGFCFPFERIDLMVLTSDEPLIVDASDRPVQLLRTCQAVRAEAEPVLRRNTVFASSSKFVRWPQVRPSMLIEHLEISVCDFNSGYLSRYYVGFPAELKSLILFCELDDCSRVDSCWNRLRRDALIIFAETPNFNVLEDLSEDPEEVVFGMCHVKELSALENRGQIIMVKPDCKRYLAQ